MILNSIIIDNIRSYSHEEVVFPRGISLFEGDIGSGKSTILMSIEFALFGLGSQKADSLLSKKSESGYVVLEFSVDGEKYEIKRTLKRKNSGVNQDPKNSWIKIKDEILPLSPSELKQQVLKILKFNEPADPKAESKIFRYAIFTPQEAMKEVLSDSGKRLETIRKAFGIEDYSIAKSNSLEVVNELRKKSAVLQERFGNIPELESEISESKENITKVEGIIASMSKNIEDEKLKEKKITEQIKSFQDKNSERIKLEAKKDNLEDKIESSKKQFVQIEQEFEDYTSELKQNNDRMEELVHIKRPETELSIIDITNEIRRVQKINDELIENNSDKNSITQDLSRLKEVLGEKINSDKQSLDDSLNDLQKEKISLDKFLDEITENNDKIKSQQVEKNTIISSLQNEIAEFAKLGSNCPTCKQGITENHHHTLVDKKQDQVEKLKKELEEIANSFFESNDKSKEIKEKIENYTLEISKIEKILPRIEEYATKSSKLEQIEAKINEIKASQNGNYGDNPVEFLSNLKEELTEFENATEQMKQILESRKKIEGKITQRKTEFENVEKEITEHESELSQTESTLESFRDIGEKISELEITQTTHRDKINELSGSLASSKEKKNNESEKIQVNEKKISESKKWQEKFKQISDIKEWFEEFFIPTISQIEKQVLLSILQNFNETYTRWYSILVEDPTKESRIDENFTPIINQDGYEQEIGYLSGGEKTSIALAYRLTLNSLMRKESESMKSNLLILDEPTDGFSKNQLGKIRELLDELKSEQIVLVSHEKELETYVDNIFQVTKENGLSKISR
ncbi:MAG: SMC family ATPase, partial [Candidatus Nitrosopelagicus sp.]|nr:SMC family ATPase [Candidatus Nitrosopelagicus sp.]